MDGKSWSWWRRGFGGDRPILAVVAVLHSLGWAVAVGSWVEALECWDLNLRLREVSKCQVC